jgi:hypothetical protein
MRAAPRSRTGLGYVRDKYVVRVRTGEEQCIWQIQFLQLVMNGLLEREGAFCVLASRGVTKVGRHEQLHARGLCLFCEKVLCLESSRDVCEGGDDDVRSGNGAFQRLGGTVVYDNNLDSRSLVFVQVAGLLAACVNTSIRQQACTSTYRTGEDGHIVDFPSIFELQELPNDMAADVARAGYGDVSVSRH